MESDGDSRTGRNARTLGDVLTELFVARGYGRARAQDELESAWEAAVGPELALKTRVFGLRHGVLTVVVSHPALLEELVAFRKPGLLSGLRKLAPTLSVRDLRFRVGAIESARGTAAKGHEGPHAGVPHVSNSGGVLPSAGRGGHR